MTSIKCCVKYLELFHSAVVDWNNYMREVFLRYFNMIGGRNMTVEVEGSLFTKRKTKAGRVILQQWIFEGFCRETNECFLVEVANSSLDALLKATVKNTEEGTTIYYKSCKGFCTTKLEEEGFNHFKVKIKV